MPVQQIKSVIEQAWARLDLRGIGNSHAEDMVEWASTRARGEFTTFGMQV